jgi:hypothetical protein
MAAAKPMRCVFLVRMIAPIRQVPENKSRADVSSRDSAGLRGGCVE